jgi:hypothetical protein
VASGVSGGGRDEHLPAARFEITPPVGMFAAMHEKEAEDPRSVRAPMR